MLDPNFAFSLMQKLLSVALVFQTLEFFFFSKEFKPNGIWSSKNIERDLKDLPLYNLFLFLFEFRFFFFILILRLISSMGLFFLLHPVLIGFLFLSTLLICVRFRGTFNGGSDYMSVILLSALLVKSIFPSSALVLKGAILYISIHVVSSYFIAGVSKVKFKGWINGQALPDFIDTSIYDLSQLSQILRQNQKLSVILSLLVIAFELLFPISLFDQRLMIIFLLFGFCFHLINVRVFGLNRFFWVWISAYPALLAVKL